MAADLNIHDILRRLDGVEQDYKTLSVGQDDLRITINGLEENITRRIEASFTRAFLTPAQSPTRPQNPYQEREYSLFQRNDKQPDTSAVDSNPALPAQQNPEQNVAITTAPAPFLEQPDNYTRKLEVLVFEGLNTFAWLTKIERIFRLGNYSDHQKLDLVSVSLDGAALGWFNSELHADPFLHWKNFKDRLLLRFGNVHSRGPSQSLFCIQQRGPVADYISRFEDLSAQVNGLDGPQLEGIFLNGLDEALRDK